MKFITLGLGTLTLSPIYNKNQQYLQFYKKGGIRMKYNRGITVVLIVLFTVFTISWAADEPQAIQFAEPELEQAVRDADGYTGLDTGSIYSKDVLGIIELYVESKKLTSIEGIQYLTNLTWLQFQDNQVSDLSPLQNLTNLTVLGFWDNQVSDISPLQNLANLTWLAFWGNQVSDLSPLQNLTNLTILYFDCNQVTDINPLQNLTNLTELVFSENKVIDISPLQNFTDLTWLEFENNQVIDISPLVNNSGLGTDDSIKMQYNNLDLAPSSQDMQDIQTLLDRGIYVSYEPQN